VIRGEGMRWKNVRWPHVDGSVVLKLHVFYLLSLPSITLKFKRSPLPVSRFPPEMAEHTCRIHPSSAG